MSQSVLDGHLSLSECVYEKAKWNMSQRVI